MALELGTNSFIDVSQADTYFTDNLQFDEWNALSGTKKSQALITAGGQINLILKEECQFVIAPVDIPVDLENANAELALALTNDAKLITAGDTSSNIKKVKAGEASVQFFGRTSGARFPANVMNLLRASDCLAASAFVGIGGETSGIDGESSFDDDCAFEKSRGWA